MSRTEVAEHLGNRAMALAASLALLLVLCGNAWAASPTETLQGVFAAVNRVLGDPEFQEKPRELMGAIHNVMGATFDFRHQGHEANPNVQRHDNNEEHDGAAPGLIAPVGVRAA